MQNFCFGLFKIFYIFIFILVKTPIFLFDCLKAQNDNLNIFLSTNFLFNHYFD